MCSFEPGSSKSPDRMDALVWALTELMISTSFQNINSWHPPTLGPGRTEFLAANFADMNASAPPGGWPANDPRAAAAGPFANLGWSPNK